MNDSLQDLLVLLKKKEEIEKEKKAIEAAISSKKSAICDRFFSVKIGDEVIANGVVATGSTIIVNRVVLTVLADGFEFRALGSIRVNSGLIDYARRGKAAYPITESFIKDKTKDTDPNVASQITHNNLHATIGKSEIRSAISHSPAELSHICDAVDMTSDYPDNLINCVMLELEHNFKKIGFLTKISVVQEDRGTGIGRTLMQEYMSNIYKATEVDFLFARYETPQQDGFDLIEFYKSYGFMPVAAFYGEMLMVSKGHERRFIDMISQVTKIPASF